MTGRADPRNTVRLGLSTAALLLATACTEPMGPQIGPPATPTAGRPPFLAAGLALETLAGGDSAGYQDCLGPTARFDGPVALVVSPSGQAFVADCFNHCIRTVSSGSVVATWVGATRPGFADGARFSAQFDRPSGVALDSSGTLYVADTLNQRIRRVTSDGMATTLAGSGFAGFADGVGSAAQFSAPQAIAVDGSGSVFVADTLNHRICRISANGQVSTLAGSGLAGYQDGPAPQAQFDAPSGLAVDASGSVYVADTFNHCIRRISPNGAVSTLAGSGTSGNGDGLAASAQFSAPSGLAIDASGSLYVADTDNRAIRKIDRAGTVSTLVGPGGLTVLGAPRGVAVDGWGAIWVADTQNNVIRRSH